MLTIHIDNPAVSPTEVSITRGLEEVAVHIRQEQIEGLLPTWLTFTLYRNSSGRRCRTESMVATGGCGCP